MWMGFGQTVANKAGTIDHSIWNPKMNVTTENCPLEFFNTTVKMKDPPFEPFTHLELYEVSYIWFSAVAWLWCVVVGLIVSLPAFFNDPDVHKKVDKKLITPAFTGMFGMCPKFIKRRIHRYYDEIGTELEITPVGNYRVNSGAPPAYNKGFVPDKMREDRF